MVRADMFDMVAAALERFGPAAGDAVRRRADRLGRRPLPAAAGGQRGRGSATSRRGYETPYFFSARSFHRDDFPTVSLTTVFRQLGDDRMTAILNEIREGVLLGHAQEQLNARADADFVPPDDEFWLTLAPTNRLVTARNRQHLERLPGDELVHHARVSGDLSLFDPPVEETLRFKVGAQVMMLNNDQGDRWVNGTLGRVVGVDYDRYGAVVEVEFADGTCADVTPFTWEATRPVVSGGSLGREVIGAYTQLPFKLAWAITIHKSQGQTLDRLVVDLTGGMFSTGQLYVALSRCTSMAGLVLKRPVLPKDLKTDRRIARFLRTSVSDVRRAAVLRDRDADGRRRGPDVAAAAGGAGGRVRRRHGGVHAGQPAAGPRGCADGVRHQRVRCPAGADAAGGVGGDRADAGGLHTGRCRGGRDAGADRFRAQAAGLRHRDAAGCRAARRAGVGPDGAGAGTVGAARRTTAPTSEDGSSAFEEPEPAESLSGLLVSRDHSAPTPAADHLPALSALLRVSRDVGAVVLGGATASSFDGVSDTPWDAAARQSVADQLRRPRPAGAADRRRWWPAAGGVGVTGCRNRLGVNVSASGTTSPTSWCRGPASVSPEQRRTRRDASSSAGRWSELAASAGLKPVKTVTKTRCEVLVTAEAGTQSGKARKASEYGKPVFTADEFLAWTRRISS